MRYRGVHETKRYISRVAGILFSEDPIRAEFALENVFYELSGKVVMSAFTRPEDFLEGVIKSAVMYVGEDRFQALEAISNAISGASSVNGQMTEFLGKMYQMNGRKRLPDIEGLEKLAKRTFSIR